MLWSSRRILTGKGLRCKIRIRSLAVECNRPAKRYFQTCRGFDLGEIVCCKNHAEGIRAQGVELTPCPRKPGAVHETKDGVVSRSTDLEREDGK